MSLNLINLRLLTHFTKFITTLWAHKKFTINGVFLHVLAHLHTLHAYLTLLLTIAYFFDFEISSQVSFPFIFKIQDLT